MRNYRRKDWQKFRQEVIELDGGVCVRCGKGPLQGTVLHVHHKQYLKGKMPWEYPYELCETLCQGCHAGEHGIIRPFSGWECFGYDDLGDLSGECELCGNAIRHVYFVGHDKWPSLEVGETCCDHLTSSHEASEHRRFLERLQRFIDSPRWKPVGDGGLRIVQKRMAIVIQPIDQGFCVVVDDNVGKLSFPATVDAKRFILENVENGKFEAYLAKLWKRYD